MAHQARPRLAIAIAVAGAAAAGCVDLQPPWPCPSIEGCRDARGPSTPADGGKPDARGEIDSGAAEDAPTRLEADAEAESVDMASAADGPVAIPEGRSCQELLNASPGLRSGIYEIDPDGAGAGPRFRAYCDMVGGAGWTLVLKTDGTTQTFAYDSPLWTNTTLLNPTSLDLTGTDAKLQGFSTVTATWVRVGLAPAATGPIRWVEIKLHGTSLQALFSSANAVTPTPKAGRAAWLGLLPGASLQANCNLEGVNVAGGNVKLRLGIIGNNENDCALPDSWIGLGGTPLDDLCGYPATTGTTGNALTCPATTNADVYRDTRAFGFVMVR